MKPVIALVGRPNVGKSTLFNKLTRTQDALVADLPGLTRDRQYGDGRVGGWPYIVIDTGGLSGAPDTLDAAMADQTLMAAREADLVVLLVDGRQGITSVDEDIADTLRKQVNHVLVCVNKIDGVGEENAMLDFYALGFDKMVAVAASHNRGISQMMDDVADILDIPEANRNLDSPKQSRRRARKLLQQSRKDEEAALTSAIDAAAVDAETPDSNPKSPSASTSDATDDIRIAFVGRPNVGKSTLINRLIGEERVIAYDQPGTTRDAVAIAFERAGKDYTLIDTAGVRRRGKVSHKVEIFSIIKTLQAVDRSNVCVMLVDAEDGITEQDLHLLGYIIDKGRALIVAINKWDCLNAEQRDKLRADLERRVEFLRFTRIHFISALHGSGVGDLFKSINRAYASAFRNMPTPTLTRLLEVAVQKHQPPMVNGRRIKLRYAHQGGMNPPIIVVHGNQSSKTPAVYQRYLINYFMQSLRLFGTPLRIEFRQGENPFSDRRRTKKPRASDGKFSAGNKRSGKLQAVSKKTTSKKTTNKKTTRR